MAKEIEVVKSLIEDFDCKLKEVARRLKIPYTTLIDKIKKLKREGILLGFFPKLNLKKLGIKLIFLKIEIENLSKYSEIINLTRELDSFISYSKGDSIGIIILTKDEEKTISEVSEKINKINGIKVTYEVYQSPIEFKYKLEL